MAFCKNCGNRLPDGAAVCPKCGTRVSGESGFDFSAKFNEFTNTKDSTAAFDPNDIAGNKLMAVLAYLSWLVLIPLIGAKDSRFARYHANQGIVLALIELAFAVARSIVIALLTFIFQPLAVLLDIILGLASILFVVFSVIGIINAANGKAKELPIIGSIVLIK